MELEVNRNKGYGMRMDYTYNEWLERNKEMDGERIIRFYERNKFYK